jgi:hypothetical protein
MPIATLSFAVSLVSLSLSMKYAQPGNDLLALRGNISHSKASLTSFPALRVLTVPWWLSAPPQEAAARRQRPYCVDLASQRTGGIRVFVKLQSNCAN